MAEVASLSRARKARDRAVQAAQAAANRAAFGRTKEQKAADRAIAVRQARALDGARRETEEG